MRRSSMLNALDIIKIWSALDSRTLSFACSFLSGFSMYPLGSLYFGSDFEGTTDRRISYGYLGLGTGTPIKSLKTAACCGDTIGRRPFCWNEAWCTVWKIHWIWEIKNIIRTTQKYVFCTQTAIFADSRPVVHLLKDDILDRRKK